jgi:hypothetical protein
VNIEGKRIKKERKEGEKKMKGRGRMKKAEEKKMIKLLKKANNDKRNKIKMRKKRIEELESTIDQFRKKMQEFEVSYDQAKTILDRKMNRENLKREAMILMNRARCDEEKLNSLMDNGMIGIEDFVGKMMTVQKAICSCKLKFEKLQ